MIAANNPSLTVVYEIITYFTCTNALYSDSKSFMVTSMICDMYFTTTTTTLISECRLVSYRRKPILQKLLDLRPNFLKTHLLRGTRRTNCWISRVYGVTFPSWIGTKMASAKEIAATITVFVFGCLDIWLVVWAPATVIVSVVVLVSGAQVGGGGSPAKLWRRVAIGKELSPVEVSLSILLATWHNVRSLSAVIDSKVGDPPRCW